jgi:hypothetical protein
MKSDNNSADDDDFVQSTTCRNLKEKSAESMLTAFARERILLSRLLKSAQPSRRTMPSIKRCVR